MAKQKMISVESMDKIAKEMNPGQVKVDFHGNELIITPLIPLRTMMEIVENVVEGCFIDSEGDGAGVYVPSVKQFLICLNLIDAYTNVRLPGDLERKYNIVYGTDIVDIIQTNINKAQLCDIYSAIDGKIKEKINTNEQYFISNTNRIINSLSNVADQVNGLFSGVDIEDVINSFKPLAEQGIDEEKIVNAIIAAKQKEDGK